MTSLLAVLLPLLAMPCLLSLAPPTSALPCLGEPVQWPVAFWCMAITGGVATIAGVLDWRFHRVGGRRVPPAEHRAELAALSLGVPLFALMATASIVADPHPWLLPIVAVALVMAGFIVFDETRFHRACGTYETVLHRLLVGGNGIAFLAWLSWCFAQDSRAL